MRNSTRWASERKTVPPDTLTERKKPAVITRKLITGKIVKMTRKLHIVVLTSLGLAANTWMTIDGNNR